ncbi:GDSL Lipase Acylhydrolase family [Cordyceps militaris]|uniref:GDSL Lipase Acylhydrolase family n=1 Tax=Cordyceps militaris TaxID=73501 RepID=A0A2H4SNS9_CORMI|nr:GDSL Lipase Acylhydrolase family [Cordyceps militaris]
MAATQNNAGWHGLASLSPGSDKYEQIKRLLSHANFAHLSTRALESRRKHQPNLPLNIQCNVNKKRFTSGFENVVFQAEFSDNVQWVVRVPYKKFDAGDRVSMLSEVATMALIKRKTTIPIPSVFDFAASAEQDFGYPYTMMERLPGHQVSNGLARSIPLQYHAKIAKQLASVFSELQNLTFSRIGRIWCGDNADGPAEVISMAWHAAPGPLETSLEYFYYQRQEENRQVMALHSSADPEWLTACWVLKSALPYMIIEDRVRGPFPLCHLDLHYGNMLFDEDYNLTGIVDWSNAQAAPLEQLSVCPEFVAFPGLSGEKNRPILELRKLVLQALEEMEKTQTKRPPIDNPDLDMTEKRYLTPLSSYMASKSAIITHRQYMATPRGSLWAGKKTAKLIYGESVSWEQLQQVYARQGGHPLRSMPSPRSMPNAPFKVLVANSHITQFQPSLYDQFILYGASIMEQASTQERGFALAPALQQAYLRRLDVVNRGFSGFNTEQGLKVLPQILPDPEQTRAILFGSNDACLPDAANGQHVPLDQYKKNLVQLVTHPALEAHKPRLLLVTPPPIEERRLDHRVKSQGYLKLNRSNVVTKQYADAAREVAKEMKVGCVDLWTAFMSKAGWKPGDPLYGSQDLPENDVIRALIHDGLHFTPEAYEIFYEEVIKVISTTWPDEMPEKLPYIIPAWDDGAAWAAEGLKMGKDNVVRHD